MGTRVLYLHGFASGPHSQKALALQADLARHGSAVEILDLAPDLARSTISSQLDLVGDALRAGPDPGAPVLLVGSSLGGWLATLAAQRWPERVGGLVLLAPAFGFAERFAARLTPDELTAWRGTGAHAVLHHATGRFEPLGIDFLDDARRHPAWPDPAAPASIHAGRHDEAVPLDAILAFARARPGTRRVRIHACGHDLIPALDEIAADLRRTLAALADAHVGTGSVRA